MAPQQHAATALIYIFLFIVITFLYLVPYIVTWWKLFKNAGKPGWAAFIPIYGSLVMCDIGEKPRWLGWTAWIVPIAADFTPMPIRQIGALIGLVINLILLIGMAKKYDRGIGFWLAVFFLPIVAVFLVKNTHYTGNVPPTFPGTPPESQPPSATTLPTPGASQPPVA